MRKERTQKYEFPLKMKIEGPEKETARAADKIAQTLKHSRLHYNKSLKGLNEFPAI